MKAIPIFEPERVMTEAEYLIFEDAAETKHEFVDGLVYDWPGYEQRPNGHAGTPRTHNGLQVNIVAALAAPAAAAGCAAYGSDMRLRVRLRRGERQTTRYYYPDAMVLCDQELRPELGDDEMHVTRPCVIVEILSRGSGRIDRGEKLDVYQSLPSVQAYLIVHQQLRRVERWWRDTSGAWQTATHTSDAVPIACIGFDLPLDTIYAGVLPPVS